MDDESVGLFRMRMKSLQRRLRQEAVSVRGLSRPAAQVLGTVGRRPQISPRDVADEMRMTSSNVAAALRELESAGLLDRRKDPRDARRVRLSVTDAGMELAARFRDERDTWLGRAVEAVLSEDEQRVLAEAGRLMERLSHFEPVAPGHTGGSPSRTPDEGA
ncbi:winged helix DNA-binding protein [Streptomyces sp. SL13]|uniref:Winged helix DNA-binding protein n=1 Tax=Streptantibioticus silvisoli TaxID=2705255 RepID=A0AA90KIN8_9ACTN|nr:MarR family transcriptional regulator [Streptantibioticus silvisoli]MDI5973440.1 winged helix DNA-binding protein [Streptantibioticus silvisoli]